LSAGASQSDSNAGGTDTHPYSGFWGASALSTANGESDLKHFYLLHRDGIWVDAAPRILGAIQNQSETWRNDLGEKPSYKETLLAFGSFGVLIACTVLLP